LPTPLKDYMQTKAILEFTYPEDEDNLLFAMKGKDMYKALTSIKMAVTGEFTHKADMNVALKRVRDLTDQMLAELGE
jgi:hypothetical protein